ncbi:MAG: HAMP domain-containing histidine kinase [Pontiellaceae bacterium]|nr:HAMP domain-containing histidine kinase [Pontiellaceae bacterium]
MDTFYAPAERTGDDELNEEIELITNSPVVAGLLQTVSGLLAVVNEQRQVVACNDKLLAELGIEDPHALLGLRPGEILKCVHAHEKPAGCGTTKYCSSCGAAIAMVTSFETNACSERLCALKTDTDEIALKVRSQPITLDGRRFLLLFLQDESRKELQASLERTFFHDIGNTLHIMKGISDLLFEDQPSKDIAAIKKATDRLLEEVIMQRKLMDDCALHYDPKKEEVDAAEVFEELRSEMEQHPAAKKKNLALSVSDTNLHLHTDRPMLMRVLSNMLINACEATPPGGTIRLELERRDNRVEFSVWNHQAIPPEIQRRIFQRHFSTKNQPGRGIGTYSTKLFGEKFLRGKVSFTSSPERGTTFRFALPA